MTGDYAYTPQLWLSLLTVVLLVALAIFGWRRRSVPGAVPFAFGCLFAALCAAGSFMEYAVVDVAAKILWVKFQAVWQLPATTAITCFILEYAWPGRWLARRNLVLLSVVPLLLLLLVLTNGLHHLIWKGFAYDGSVLPLIGPAAWYVVGYGYVLGIVNILLVGWLFLHWPQYRWPMALVLLSQVGGRVVYLLEKLYVVGTDLPLDILGVLVVFVAWAIVLFGFRILDPVPLARQAVIAQMRDGLLVLDAEGRVASLNPAAQAMLGTSERTALGQPVQALLPMVPDVGGGHLAAATEPVEVHLGVDPQARHYLLEASALKDVRGLDVGSVLLLHDVTEQHRARAQILSQQRALAMLQERERLARELHDSTGQVIGYVSLQAQAIAKWVREGDTARAEDQLTRMAALAQEAHAELRGSILSLRTEEPESWSLRAALEQYLAAYQEHYGIRAELHLPPDLALQELAPEVGAQLVRVIQEALTNARKHSGARNVQVIFAGKGMPASVVVADDGCGFNLNALPAGGQDHFGLAFMQERMARVGGSLRVDTAPGAGTRVVLELPHGFTPRRPDAGGRRPVERPGEGLPEVGDASPAG
ncbi:MAG TPA: histidine kinase N-terminal 7TM domain-containing protein [Anaerolineae bacterium]|nr:histidine kinase N-terminal 7TM domain-containing protein [Anaerolineae bacterium]